jgi:hypothetical protein
LIEVVTAHPVLAYFAAGLACAEIYTELQRWILPLRIPATEVAKIAEDLVAQFGPEALNVAVIEQDRALHYSDPYQQGKWRRVEREVRRKLST